MLFNSLSFLLFFPLVTTLYFLLPHRYRWFMLLVSSCIFYMWFIPQYILILAITIIIDYLAGIWIEDAPEHKKKRYLIISILSTCLVLFIFKYFNFFNDNFRLLAQAIGWNYPVEALAIILPIGLSFHTFQSLSYVVEVYRKNQKSERHFGIYSLYVMFYPQLVAGPIERPQNLLHQFYEEHHFDYRRVTDGLKLMAWGLFKKIVIADRLAVLVNQVYNNPNQYDGPFLVLATIFFAFQIYCDFSGYSDVAIGAAQVMGFKLMKNFDRPYYSKSISEFWKRWHISLSSWFKDYLYFSLGGNRCSKPRWQFNLFFTFLVSGLWHGANWTYIIWGGMNGFYLIFALWTAGLRNSVVELIGINRYPRLFKIWQIAVTFTLVCLSWIFFRAKSATDGFYIVTHLFKGWDTLAHKLLNMNASSTIVEIFNQFNLGISHREFFFVISMIVVLELIHLQQRKTSARQLLMEYPAWVRCLAYNALVCLIILSATSMTSEGLNFIYFQF